MTKVKSIIIAGLTMISIGQIHAQYGTGATFTKAKNVKEFSASGLGFSSEIPTSFSLKNYAPYAKNQGIYSSCSGWGVSYEALSIQYAIANGITNRNHITAKAFCPYYSYNKAQPEDLNCMKGANAGNLMNTIKLEGGKKFYLPLLGCGSKVSDEFEYASKYYKIQECYSLKNVWPEDVEFDGNDITGTYKKFFAAEHKMDLNAFKQCISLNYPIVISVALPSSFYDAGEFWEPTPEEKANPSAAIMDNTGAHRFHCMTVVGYDDNKYGGAFEVMNSWSESWGNKGFFWVKYADFRTYVYEAFVMDMFPTDASLTSKTGPVWGDCVNGYGFYRFANGQTYEGQYKDGKYHGYGVYTWPDGQAYAGQFKNGKRDGEATCYFSSGSFGQATYSNDLFVSGYNELKFTSGDYYKGYIKNGEYEGYGDYTFASGERYLAMFSNGTFNGLVKHFATDGSTFLGFYSDGKRNGKGINVSASGQISAGEWVYGVYQAGKSYGFAAADALRAGAEMSSTLYLSADCESGNCLTGEGKRITGNGNIYEGTFVDGLEDGKGKMNYGEVYYDGAWKQGKMHGLGEVKSKAGITLIAEFKKGNFDGYVLKYDNLGNMIVYQYIDGLNVKTFNEISASPSTGASSNIPSNQKSILTDISTAKK